jgi:pyruvyltransferase
MIILRKILRVIKYTAYRLFFNPLNRVLKRYSSRGIIPLKWFSSKNWGDALNPYLVEKLSHQQVVYVANPHLDNYICIGSMISTCGSPSVIWGTGIISEAILPTRKPKQVLAVRGPLTRDVLLGMGVDCPMVYGDPALLLPMFYDPVVEVNYDVGIIPHYVDAEHPWVLQYAKRNGIRIINVCGGIDQFVREVKSCRVILSSSLHGLICADAYGVSCRRIQLSESVIGGDFKFNDYRLSVDGRPSSTLMITEQTTLDEAVDGAVVSSLDIDLHLLLRRCPFLSPNIAHALDSVADGSRRGRVFLREMNALLA